VKKVLFRVLLIVVCLGLVVALFACAKQKKEAVKVAAAYRIEAQLDGAQLTAEQTVTVFNVYGADLSEAVFNLYPNAYQQTAVQKAYSGTLKDYGGIAVTSVRIAGADVNVSLSENEQHMTVPIAGGLKSGKSVDISMSYVVTIPSGNFRLSLKNGNYALANFYPQLAVYTNGAFRTDSATTIGDPMFSDIADYNVTLTVEEDLVVASSGKLISEAPASVEGLKTLNYQGKAMRDFAFALNKDFNVVSADVNGIAVSYYYVSDAHADTTLGYAADALAVFSDAFCSYPFPTYSIVKLPFAAGGMEFSALVYIADATVDVQNTVIHETAHQWWYGIVGVDGINSAYIDEGLATFSTAYYYKLTANPAAFEAEVAKSATTYAQFIRLQNMSKLEKCTAMNMSIYDYTAYQYNVLVYDKSCLMFKNVYDLVGDAAFSAAIKTLATQNQFKILSEDTLFNTFNSKGRTGVDGVMRGWLQ